MPTFAIPNDKGIHNRGVAQLASASGLGPEGPVFESQYPDNVKNDYLISSGRFFVVSLHEPLALDNCECGVLCNWLIHSDLLVCPAWRGRQDKCITC